ncbi:MAG: TRAP transporter substrate-binding protein DctP [Mailhella sp.]|nr:TRAP transporter substrate-binding protein DctP [Mailhella sp.]
MKKLSLSLLAAALLFLGAGTSHAEKYELNFQAAYAPAHTVYKNVLTPWCEEVSAQHPDLKVLLFAQGAILEPKEVQDGLVNGMLDMSVMNCTFDAKKYPASFLGNLPMLYDSSAMGTEFGWRLYNELPEYKDTLEKCAHVFCMWAPATTGFFSAKSPIHTPDDLKGKRVLVMLPSDVEVIKVLGGIPVLVAPGDIYVGLQRGMGELTYTAWPMANGLRLDEVCKYVTLCPFAASLMPHGISHMTANNLPKDVLQVILDNSGTKLSDKVSKALDEDVANVQARFRAAGCELIELNAEQLAAFQDKAKALVESYWIPFLESIGLKNAKELVAKTYAIADEVRAAHSGK